MLGKGSLPWAFAPFAIVWKLGVLAETFTNYWRGDLKQRFSLLATSVKLVSVQNTLNLLSHKLSPESNFKVCGDPLLFPSRVPVKAATEGLCAPASLTLTEGVDGSSQKATVSVLNHLHFLSYLKREKICSKEARWSLSVVSHPAEPLRLWTNHVSLPACLVLTDWPVFWIQTMLVLLFYFPLKIPQ